MTNLSFEFGDMLREIEFMQSLSAKFITESSSAFVLHQWKTRLEQFRGGSRKTLSWAIPLDQPIETRLSEGEYQRGGSGRHVCATISAVWEISKATPKRRNQRSRNFMLSGNASTLIRVFAVPEDAEKEQVAEWRFDIGDSHAPGCFLHNQVNWEFTGRPAGTSAFDIPRLPTILVTPMDALEFVLGELFQDSWPKHALARSTQVSSWANIQKRRLLKVLDWNYRTIQNSRGSPWTCLKLEKPADTEFLGDPPRNMGAGHG